MQIRATRLRDKERKLILVDLSIVRVDGSRSGSPRFNNRLVEQRSGPFLVIEDVMADLWIC